MSHALSFAELIERGQASGLEAAELLYKAGWYLDDRARYVEAEPLYRRALSIREQQLGMDHADVAASLNNLAALYDAQGKHAEAEPLYQRALSIQEQNLGEMHPYTATSLNNLAELCRVQGKYEQAESLYQRALPIREQKFGEMHPDTAQSLNNLALLIFEPRKVPRSGNVILGWMVPMISVQGTIIIAASMGPSTFMRKSCSCLLNTR